MGGIFQLRMEIEQSVVRVNSFQCKLDTKAFTPDMFYLTPVVLVNGLHNQPDEQGRFATQLLQVNIHRIVRAVHRFAITDKVGHLDA